MVRNYCKKLKNLCPVWQISIKLKDELYNAHLKLIIFMHQWIACILASSSTF